MGSTLRQTILGVSREIIAERGLGSLTFDAVARRIGKSKQAVLYWFPTKQDLLRELAVPWIESEANAVQEAVADAKGAKDAIDRAVRRLVAFHLEDLDRFRQLYLSIQLDARPQNLLPQGTLERDVHPVTGRMYAAIANEIDRDPEWPRDQINQRRAAVVVHMAALGLVLMVALGDAVDDPLTHRTDDLVDTLVHLLVH